MSSGKLLRGFTFIVHNFLNVILQLGRKLHKKQTLFRHFIANLSWRFWRTFSHFVFADVFQNYCQDVIKMILTHKILRIQSVDEKTNKGMYQTARLPTSVSVLKQMLI